MARDVHIRVPVFLLQIIFIYITLWCFLPLRFLCFAEAFAEIIASVIAVTAGTVITLSFYCPGCLYFLLLQAR